MVTGGAGFLGTALCFKLLQQGHKVVCIDNLSTGLESNLKENLGYPNFSFVNHDVLNPIQLTQKFDQIYHLACPASPIQYQKNPIYTLETAVLGTLNILRFAQKQKSIFLLASTSEVYGDPKETPQSESYLGHVNPVGIRSCYDEGKRAAETLTMDFHRVYSQPVKIVRIFNTYGPKMMIDDGRVISNFIVQALKEQPITIYGNGLQTRSFCFVTDLIEGLIQVMQLPVTGPINLGNPEEHSILHVANKIQIMTKTKSVLTFKELPKDDPIQRKPDISYAIHLFGWKPKISLDQGLKHTINFFKQTLA